MAFSLHSEFEQAGRPAGRQACWLSGLLACRPAGLLACVWLWFYPHVAATEEAPLSEYQVKAALLLNFVRYSDWPATAFANSNSPYVVGIVGRDPFGKDLERAFDRKPVKGRPFVLKRVSGEQEMRACHLLFVSSSERRRSRDLLGKISGAPVLTVGDSPDFLDQGGMINFLIKDGSVRFEINLEPVRNARLKLDANLLKVGVSVRGKHE